jgi:hypothetical protein
MLVGEKQEPNEDTNRQEEGRQQSDGGYEGFSAFLCLLFLNKCCGAAGAEGGIPSLCLQGDSARKSGAALMAVKVAHRPLWLNDSAAVPGDGLSIDFRGH